jgi:hypothetical protein
VRRHLHDAMGGGGGGVSGGVKNMRICCRKYYVQPYHVFLFYFLVTLDKKECFIFLNTMNKVWQLFGLLIHFPWLLFTRSLFFYLSSSTATPPLRTANDFLLLLLCTKSLLIFRFNWNWRLQAMVAGRGVGGGGGTD